MSREKKFTPGPWFFGIRGTLRTKTNVIIAAGHKKICDLIGKDTDEQKANANLVAAAPELLEALERIRAEFTRLKGLATTLRDQIYLDGVLAVIETESDKVIKKAYGETE